MEAGCQIEERALGKGGSDQRNPEGQPVFAKTRGDRNRRQIEQVHEIGIKTEIGIEAERVRCDRSFLVDRASGRQKQYVERLECEIGLALQLRQFVLGAIGVERTVMPALSMIERVTGRIASGSSSRSACVA